MTTEEKTIPARRSDQYSRKQLVGMISRLRGTIHGYLLDIPDSQETVEQLLEATGFNMADADGVLGEDGHHWLDKSWEKGPDGNNELKELDRRIEQAHEWMVEFGRAISESDQPAGEYVHCLDDLSAILDGEKESNDTTSAEPSSLPDGELILPVRARAGDNELRLRFGICQGEGEASTSTSHTRTGTS